MWFKHVLALPKWNKKIVGVNEVGIAFWLPVSAVQWLTTGYLNSCTGIV